jgi:ribulose-5-phosphate 4-epimerase/fuculose-1-phosphate aldolase
MMELNLDMKIKEMVANCHRAGGYRLQLCSSGNISWRIDGKRVLMTASRSWIAEIEQKQIAVIDFESGESVNGVTPSVEKIFHLGVLREHEDANVVLHFQSPAATVLTCGDMAGIDFNVTPEFGYYIRSVGQVPFLTPGTRELADAVIACAKEHALVILQNHGQVTYGRDFNEAIQRAVFFEMICEIILRGGDNLKRLTPEQVASLTNA